MGVGEGSFSHGCVFKSNGRDKNVSAITHPVCPRGFIEWDRNWLTKRTATL